MARASFVVLRIALVLAAAVCLFTIENIWIDPWVQSRSHHKLPSLAPETLGGMWFLILLALAVSVAFLVVSQVLLMRDASIPKKQKWLTGIFVFLAAVLAGQWFAATSGVTLAERNNAASQADRPQNRS